MPLVFRTLLFGFVTLLVVVFIIDDIAEVEEETANTGHSQKMNLHQLIPQPHRKAAAQVDPTALTRLSKDVNHLGPSYNTTVKLSSNNWTFNKTLSNLIRKNILRFLDPERDISILKGTLKPGDIIHYVFDRHSTINISENLYRLLPTVSPMKNQHHRRCAIVGNSGILLNSSCGPDIDSHDFVIRCNLAPVEEYFQDVGWRTNLVTMNPSVVQRAFQDLVSEEWRDRFLQRLQSLSGSVLWIPAFMAKGGEERVEWALRLILLHTVDVRTAFPSLRLLHAVRGHVCFFGGLACFDYFLVIDNGDFPEFCRHGEVTRQPAETLRRSAERIDKLLFMVTVNESLDAANRILYIFVNRYWLTNNVHIKRPTTGLLMYTMATRFCEEIHLYGFWPFPLDPQGRSVKYHYYDTLKYEYTSSSSPHTMPLEFRTLSALHRQGALRLHTGTCDAERRPQKELQRK